MGIVEKTPAAAPAMVADFDRFRLRRFVEGLGDELEIVGEATDLADVAIDPRRQCRKPCCSARSGPSIRSLSATSPAAARASRALSGSQPSALLPRDAAAPAQPAGHRRGRARRSSGAGDRADRRGRRSHHAPGPSRHGADGAPYISSSIDFVVDPESGWTNVGVRRLMLRGRREAGIDLGLAERSARDLREQARPPASRCP